MDLIDQEKLSEHIDNWAMRPESTSSRRKNTFQTKGTIHAKSWRRKAHGVCEEMKGNQMWLKDNGGGDETRLGRMTATNAGKTEHRDNFYEKKFNNIKMFRPSVPEIPFLGL